MIDIPFLILSVLAIVTAIMALESREIIYGAVSLAITFLMIAGFFIILQVPFLAMFQIIINVGAVAVIILFTVMLVGTGTVVATARDRKYSIFAITVGIVFAVGLILILSQWPGAIRAVPISLSIKEWVGGIASMLIGPFTPVFLTAALLLTAALIGALTLAKSEGTPEEVKDG